MGSKQFRTIARALKHVLTEPLHLRKIVPTEPYYITVAGEADAVDLENALRRLAENQVEPYDLLEKEEAPYLGKYDEFIAPELLRKAFAADGIDMDAFVEIARLG